MAMALLSAALGGYVHLFTNIMQVSLLHIDLGSDANNVPLGWHTVSPVRHWFRHRNLLDPRRRKEPNHKTLISDGLCIRFWYYLYML